jgi:hypothetical protein
MFDRRVYWLQSFVRGRRLPALNIRLRRSEWSLPHFIERERVVRYRLERRDRRRSARAIGASRPTRFFKLQSQRRITRWTRPAARPITAEPGGKFVTPGRGILALIARGHSNCRRPRLGLRITLL